MNYEQRYVLSRSLMAIGLGLGIGTVLVFGIVMIWGQ